MIFNAYQDNDKGLFGINVVSAGHIFAKKNRTVNRPKGRKDYLLFYVAKGKEHFFLDKEVVLSAGEFIIFRPYEKQHHIQKDDGISEFYYIHFNAPENFDLLGFNSFVVYSAKESVKVIDLFEEIISELHTKQPSYEKICCARLFTIFALLERKCVKYISNFGQYYDNISFVIQTMNKEYYKNYSLDDFANMCNMSKFHFLRVFKSVAGDTPVEYRNKIRIEHAKEMLTDSDISVEEIGRRVGYNSNSYFCDVFKGHLGVSPSKYRKMWQH